MRLPVETRTCPNCGEKFGSVNGSRRFCSPDCAHANNPARKCEYCGNKFKPVAETDKTCYSKQCVWRATTKPARQPDTDAITVSASVPVGRVGTCAYCLKPFTATYCVQKFCLEPACRLAHKQWISEPDHRYCYECHQLLDPHREHDSRLCDLDRAIKNEVLAALGSSTAMTDFELQLLGSYNADTRTSMFCECDYCASHFDGDIAWYKTRLYDQANDLLRIIFSAPQSDEALGLLHKYLCDKSPREEKYETLQALWQAVQA